MTSLFGTDGIRSTAGEWPLTPEFVLRLGQAAGLVLNPNGDGITIVVGRDTRASGPMLQNALVAGLLSYGVHVVEVGVIPTPGVAWLLRSLKAEAGVVISASHNPVEQNGVKFFGANGQKLRQALEEEIERLVLEKSGEEPSTFHTQGRLGRLTDGQNLHELYIRGLLSEHPPRMLEGLTLLVDCANGAAAHFAPEVFSRAGARVIAVHAAPTGLNINARAGSEHVRRQPEEMGNLIRQSQADFGLAFDGDADRVVFVDQDGHLIDGDHMLGFLSRYLRDQGRLAGGAVVTTNMRNTGLKHYVESLGLQMYETPVGDKYVVEKLVELRLSYPETGKYGLGGEQAGHIVLIDEFYTTGDGMRTALFVMRAFSESGVKTITEFAAGIGKTPQIIASAYVGQGPRLDRARIIELEKEMADNTPGLARISLRYSGTEPQFRVMLESNGSPDEHGLAKTAISVCRQIQKVAGLDEAPIDVLNCTRGGVIQLPA